MTFQKDEKTSFWDLITPEFNRLETNTIMEGALIDLSYLIKKLQGNPLANQIIEQLESLLRTCLISMIRMLCCYKSAIKLRKIFGILINMPKIFRRFIVNFSTQIIRSKILDRF